MVLSEEAAKAKARTLRKGLGEMGQRIKHAQALELVARLEGAKNWSELNALQVRASTTTPAPPTAPVRNLVLVGQENLLPGYVQVDEVPVDSFGGTRKMALVDAMRVCGLPYAFRDPVIELAQREGAFSAPPMAARGAQPDSEERYDDDPAPCNVHGQTRAEVVMRALEAATEGLVDVSAVFDEFRARSGLVGSYQPA